MKQARQGLLEKTAMRLYCQKDERVHHMFSRVVMDSILCVGYVNKACYFHRILETGLRELLMAQAMLRPRAFEMDLYVNAHMFLEACMRMKLVLVMGN